MLLPPINLFFFFLFQPFFVERAFRIFDRDGNEVFKSDSYTQGQVLEALETARGAS